MRRIGNWKLRIWKLRSRPQTCARLQWQIATARASAASSGSGASRSPRIMRTISCTCDLCARPLPTTAFLTSAGVYWHSGHFSWATATSATPAPFPHSQRGGDALAVERLLDRNNVGLLLPHDADDLLHGSAEAGRHNPRSSAPGSPRKRWATILNPCGLHDPVSHDARARINPQDPHDDSPSSGTDSRTLYRISASARGRLKRRAVYRRARPKAIL